jgi:hypothetical protein
MALTRNVHCTCHRCRFDINRPAAAVNVYQAKEGEVACSVIVKFQFTREGASDQY